jgi:hypothetical protein
VELDIRDNKIPDRSLKMLEAMLVKNESLLYIHYTLYEKINIIHLERYEKVKHLPSKEIQEKIDDHYK